MLYDCAATANGELAMAALAASRVEIETQPIPAGIPPGAPDKLPAVHTPYNNTRIVRNCYRTLAVLLILSQFSMRLCDAADAFGEGVGFVEGEGEADGVGE